MPIQRSQIEALAPDQSALTAAGKLLKPANWASLGTDSAAGLIWGECQGSGANPYRVMADLSDLGSKCTCPSRKFPCKHALALMWLCAESTERFAPGAVPEWVTDWLGRRRKSDASTPPKTGGASLSEALSAEADAPPDPQALAKKAAAAEKRAAKTKDTVLEATEELDAWIADQVRTGLAGFLADANARCRRIAARLVDGKAAGLASRVDEMPARLLQVSNDERATFALTYFSRLILLVRAFRQSPERPEIWREIVTAENRDDVLNNPDALRVNAIWEVAGERIETRRDGLVSHATWLKRMSGEADAPRFALLLDFYPASAGKRALAFVNGDVLQADVVFYPSSAPLRALIASRAPATPPGQNIADNTRAPLSDWRTLLQTHPWTDVAPLQLFAGRIGLDANNRAWWQPIGAAALPLDERPAEYTLGLEFDNATALWNGTRLHLLSAQSVHGRINFDA